jgi:diaminohydroxyphosphoribosylaminopyrimidine deaminase/5-amino-6-(5-phosphoribosylamino)uracil reductase
VEVGAQGIDAPIGPDRIPPGFRKLREMRFDQDGFAEWVRTV